jgi:hypothetical protein
MGIRARARPTDREGDGQGRGDRHRLRSVVARVQAERPMKRDPRWPCNRHGLPIMGAPEQRRDPLSVWSNSRKPTLEPSPEWQARFEEQERARADR